MMLYSQHDPSYDKLKLGGSKLTIHTDGCFLVSLANFFQHSPVDLLKIPGGVNTQGLVVSGVIAHTFGSAAGSPQTLPPEGWSIAITDHYKAEGYPTHFFCYNHDTKQMIDPLTFPAAIDICTYNITSYRPFTNCKLVDPGFPDVPLDSWYAEAVQKVHKAGLMTGGLDGTFKPDSAVTRSEMAVILMRALHL
jgi:hypothetical protein